MVVANGGIDRGGAMTKPKKEKRETVGDNGEKGDSL